MLTSPVHTVLYTNKRLMTIKEFRKNKPNTDIQPGEGIFVLYLGYLELVTKETAKHIRGGMGWQWTSEVPESKKILFPIDGKCVETSRGLAWDYAPFKSTFQLLSEKEQKVTCSDCSGKGYIKATNSLGHCIHSWYRGTFDRDCNNCNGKGHLIENN